MKTESLCQHAGYSPKNGEPRVVPIVQSTTFKYDSTDEVAKLFDLAEAGFFYTRLGNPTVDAVERKIAALEGGVGALCTSSGQAASMIAVLNICKAGDHFVSASSIYGGTFNLFAVTLKRLGIDVTFINQRDGDEEIEKAFRPNTRLVFGETLTNPSMDVFDIERFARLAHAHSVPLIVDNTFATPILCRPFEFGADVVVHSTTKYMDGHALQMGGVIVDSGNFDWKAHGRFPELTEPDESYHGLVYTEAFGNAAYIVKARAQLMRDMGCCQTPQGAFYLNQGLETLPLRMERHCRNAEVCAEFLSAHPKVASVKYPGLLSSPDRALAAKYVPRGASGVISFSLKGGRDAGARFIDSLGMISLQVHVADIRTCVLHPASSTHRQLSDAQLADAGIDPGMVRLSVGLENADDIIADLTQALEKA
ncbi:MAG: O-acetylhomoserine aminocarboxypropyltransferase/cysteine synthase [Desulfovibrio sp.]|nr:O-acetylhomoserine aminocarboxypropyltransferase/cysteine synthase [Desulfovibrio sp.]